MCLKELGILLKCRETFEQFFAACNSSKNTCYAEFYEFKTTSLTSKTTFFKKVNPLKYPVQTYILVLLFTYLLVYPIKSIICIPSHEIYTKCNKKHLTWLKLYLVIISTLKLKVNKQKNHLSFKTINFWFFSGFLWSIYRVILEHRISWVLLIDNPNESC